MRQKQQRESVVSVREIAAAVLVSAAGMSWAGLGGAAWGEPIPDAAPADDAGALKGPSVNERGRQGGHEKPTLVERDFEGELKRLDQDPVIAGLEKIGLTPEEKAAAEKIVYERYALLDGLVQEHLRTIVELAQSRQAGDREATRKYVGVLLAEFQPLIKRGPLLDELKGVLPADKHAKLAEMTREYRRESAKDREKSGGERPGGAMVAEFLESFGGEIKRSYQRVVGSRTSEFEETIKRLGLSEEQEAKVRRMVTDSFQKNIGKSSRREKARVFMSVYRELDAQQRQTLMQILKERRGVETPDRE